MPEYEREMLEQQNEQTDDPFELKGYMKSERELRHLHQQVRQEEIERRQGMKLEEHSKRLEKFVSEIDQRFQSAIEDNRTHYQVSYKASVGSSPARSAGSSG